MIRLKNVTILNGDFRVSDVSFELVTGSYAVIAGPTGSGKSTLLEAIVGLKQIDSGSIFVGTEEVSSSPAALRSFGYVPQDVCLFPTMTVEQQLAFPLEVRSIDASLRTNRINELIEQLGLDALRNRLPSELSGGQQQRVAIGRAIAVEPKLLCLDEPLSSIDAEQRNELVSLLKSIHEKHSTTILHVTHQTEDLRSIKSKLIQMRDGRLVDQH